MPDTTLDLFDLDPAVRELIGECELTGRRTRFSRNGRIVAILMSHDEYLALGETLAITNDPETRARLATADEQVSRGAILLPEDLIVE